MKYSSEADFLKDGSFFFERLISEFQRLGMNPLDLSRCDHLCFRVENIEQFKEYKNFLATFSKLLSEAMVNGRSICTFELHRPVSTSLGEIPLIELPSPKPGSPYALGFEHAEFVISESFDLFQKKYPAFHFEALSYKTLNTELCLRSKVGQAKFHHLSLKRVIEIEETKITDVVFDFDGTLIIAKDKILKINARVFSEVLNREVSLAEAEKNFSSSFAGLFKNFGIVEQSTQQQVVDLWSKYSLMEEFDFFKGAKELLKSIKAMNMDLHIWTAREEASTRKILKHHDLEDLFTSINCLNHKSAKPHVENFQTQLLADHKRFFLMIGDTANDIRAAKNIKAVAGAALWDPHAEVDAMVAEGAELFFSDFKSVQEWLAQF